MIVWREKMSVGHEVLDADHRYLLCLVNSVELAMRTDEPLDELLDQFVEYARFHFMREERIQMDVRYPNAEKHRNEHRQLATQLTEALSKLRRPSKPAAATALPSASPALPASDEPELARTGKDAPPAEVDAPPQAQLAPASSAALEAPAAPSDGAAEAALVDLLRRWLIDHILREDMQFKPYMAKHPTARSA